MFFCFFCFSAVLKLLLEKVCSALTNIPEEAIFPLIDFSGINLGVLPFLGGGGGDYGRLLLSRTRQKKCSR